MTPKSTAGREFNFPIPKTLPGIRDGEGRGVDFGSIDVIDWNGKHLAFLTRIITQSSSSRSQSDVSLLVIGFVSGDENETHREQERSGLVRAIGPTAEERAMIKNDLGKMYERPVDFYDE